MKRIVAKDPFFDKQPPLKFIEELKKPLFTEKPPYYGKSAIEAGEVDVHGLYLKTLYPDDSDNLLETVYQDINHFLKVYEISGDRYPIIIRKGKTQCFEAYEIEITAENIVITADDTEGVRRALIYIEDKLRSREDAFLTAGKISRAPKIRSRITRCFFSPINRPPRNGDELNDDIDYYPEEYLNRLMHDGTNGVWIYTRFSDLIPSSIITEFGEGYEKRIAKLNRTIEKCRRYGIGVYVFAIEPISLPGVLADKYPDMVGAPIWDADRTKTFCTASERSKKFCYEAGELLVKLAPHLAGFISITFGERVTNCCSLPSWYFENSCPRCRGKNQGVVVAEAVEALCSGFRAANPKCEVVSWTYSGASWTAEEIHEYVKNAPADAMLMQNFEDHGEEEQLGRTRYCVDYWLAYNGPCKAFKTTAEEAKKYGKHMFVKMQVCCSHELASVPYIPVPGKLFKKYKSAYELGVEGVMQCWFFGNYPSLMSKAAGELSFDDFEDEDRFLFDLAAIYWGRSKAEAIVKVWKAFETSYHNYPRNIVFSYHGPMHDGVVWKLALKPKNFALGRTWQSDDPSDGDRIGECLMHGHTLEEAIILVDRMCVEWEEGMRILETIPMETDDEREQYSIAQALKILYDSSRNILLFYQLRDQLGRQIAEPLSTLAKMRALVEAEIQNSLDMSALCEKDSRLGFHSEAEAFKFFPEKMRDRIEQLEELLKTEFPEVEERAASGLSPLAYYDGEEDNPDVKRYEMYNTDISDAKWETISEQHGSMFRMAYDDKYLYLELKCDEKRTFTVSPEFQLLWPRVSMLLLPNGNALLETICRKHFSVFGDVETAEYDLYANRHIVEGDGTYICVTFDRAKLGFDIMRPFRMRFVAGKSWCKDDCTVKSHAPRPGEYGWILPQ